MSFPLIRSAEPVIALVEVTRQADPLALSIARLLLVVPLVSAPWAFGAVPTWAWVSLCLLTCVALFMWALGVVRQQSLKVVWSPLYIPLAMFFLLGLLQYKARFTLDTSETRQALVLLATDLILFFLTVQLFASASSRSWRTFGLLVLLLSASLGLFAILQFATGGRQIYGRFDTPGHVHFGPYVNPNHYAGLIEMLIPVAVFYIPERNGRSSVADLILLILAATLGMASLLLSGSRGGLLALSTETLIAMVACGWSARRRERRSLTTAVAITILTAMLLFLWVDSGWVSKRLGLIGIREKTVWAEWTDFRKGLVLDSLRMLRAHPILGVGLGNFETAYPGYQSFPSDLWIDHAHNDYVEAIAETGLIGAALIFWALILFFRLAFRDLAHSLRSEHGWIRFGAVLGCCGLLVHSFVDFNLHIPANAAWFAVLGGVGTVATSGKVQLPQS
jgi:O-antigen ligase